MDGSLEAAFEQIPAAPRYSIQATPFEWVAPEAVEPRQWVYGRHAARGYVSATIAPGGLGKSSLVLVEALAMVTGRSLLGIKVREPLRVWYWNGEDPVDEIDRRIAAACLRHGVKAQDIGGRLFRDSGRNSPISIAERNRDGADLAMPVIEALEATIIQNGIDVVILDPFVATHAVSENDNGQINAVVRALGGLADRTKVAIELVHHVRKAGGGGRMETTADDARGAGALVSGARSVRVLNEMGKEEATALGVDAAERRRFFRVQADKVNMAPRGGSASWHQLEDICLGNAREGLIADQVGVVCQWAPASCDATASELAAVQREIAGGEWRENNKSDEWAGYAIAKALGLNTHDSTEKARAESLLKRCLLSGALRTERRPDAHRKPRNFVVVGEVAE